MPTVQELKTRFDCKTRDARSLSRLLAKAEVHGALQKYGKQPLAHDDWHFDVGVDIEQLAVGMLADHDELVRLYKTAYRHGFAPAKAA